MEVLQYEILRNIQQEIDYKRRLASLPEGRDLSGIIVRIKISQGNGKLQGNGKKKS
jgi:hypothetical protein